MTLRTRTLEALSVLLPAGALGISVALASTPAEALAVPSQSAAAMGTPGEGVSARLKAIRSGVSAVTSQAAETDGNPNIVKAWWGNGGWGRWHGGWGRWRGGWGNGGWGWHNGWHNGGWGNGGWGNGGWPNFWHNW
jgi:rSAM-associated Gly-rich repeat protein